MPSDSRKTILSLACLALFTFAFLGSEFYFDTVMEGFVDPSSVVMAQSYVLGSSVIGFLAFSLTRHIPKRKLLAFGAPALALICVACLMLINARINAGVVQRAGCVLFAALGMVGAGAHWATACALSETRFVARGVGFAYAGGLIIQFVFNALTENGLGAALMLCVGSIGAIALLALSWPSQPASAEKTGNGLLAQNVRTGASEASIARKALSLTVLVILLTCLFSTVDNIVTLANATGSIDVEIWPRLLLAASAVAAGFVFDAANRRFMGPAMFCVMLLSALAVLAEDLGAGPLAGLIVFYLSSGVFVVFFTSAFLIMAPLTRNPRLWAGMGRAANNACAIAVVSPSLALVQSNSTALVMAVVVVLFAAVSALMFALHFMQGSFMAAPAANHAAHSVEEPDKPDALPQDATSDSGVAAFAEEYGLTLRETDIFQDVVQTEKTLQQIADDQGISLRMVQRHLTAIYQKTGTQTRAGLTSRFYE